MKTKAQMVVDVVRERELKLRTPDERFGFRPSGTHHITVLPPYMAKHVFGGGELEVELTPGHELLFHIRELRTAMTNAQVEARKDRADRPGEINS